MSTRSGKQIHHSFHLDSAKSEVNITKSERKTRSKHLKENAYETNAAPKQTKRNFVAYPGDDCGVDTVDATQDAGTTRALRKKALKERNFASSIGEESSVDPVRSTRRTRKFAENDVTGGPQPEEPKKPKKSKKNKKGDQVQLATESTENVPKKKSKKKKGRRSSSIIVEDIEPQAPTVLNKSNTSVDSFQSAITSPMDISDAVPETVPVDLLNTSIENDAFISKSAKSEVRLTRSVVKLNYTLINEIPPRRSSHDKGNLEHDLQDAKFADNRKKKVKNLKSSIKDVPTERLMDNDYCHSVLNPENKTITPRKLSDIEINIPNKKRKSVFGGTSNVDVEKTPQNVPFNKTVTPKISFDNIEINVSNKKRKSFVGVILVDSSEEIDNIESNKKIINTTFEKDSDVSESAKQRKKRKSTINAITKIAEITSPLVSIKNGRKSVSNILEIDEFPKGKIKSSKSTNVIAENSPFKFTPSQLFIDDNQKVINTTFEKYSDSSDQETVVKKNFSFGKTKSSSPFKSADEEPSSLKANKKNSTRKSVLNTTYENDLPDRKNNTESPANTTFDKEVPEVDTKINTTFEKEESSDCLQENKSLPRQSCHEVNSTIDIDLNKFDATFDKNSKSSLISSDNSIITLDKSDASGISITDDDSHNVLKEDIMNTTPLLIESSLDESHVMLQKSPKEIIPLKREGTFTKDETTPKTPLKQMSAEPLPSAGFTPFHVNKSTSKQIMNVTRSIEKRRSSVADLPPRATKVMFCSPVNNPAVVAQLGRKVIKSNLKGSNKSFVFDDSVCVRESRPAARKRSFTQSDADSAAARAKRSRLTGSLLQSVERLSRPRTCSASGLLTAKPSEPSTPKKGATPKKEKASRTKLPNFAALHQKEFDKMESLSECQERRAKRAKLLLTPTGTTELLDRISPRDKAESVQPAKEAPKKPETPVKSLPTFRSLNPGYTRFGFKLNLDYNPFSIPSKTQTKPKENKPNGKAVKANGLKPKLVPSLAGATSVRREVAKQTVMREKSFTDKRSENRTENRTVIKGVRTNRRFELQMKMRDI